MLTTDMILLNCKYPTIYFSWWIFNVEILFVWNRVFSYFLLFVQTVFDFFFLHIIYVRRDRAVKQSMHFFSMKIWKIPVHIYLGIGRNTYDAKHNLLRSKKINLTKFKTTSSMKEIVSFFTQKTYYFYHIFE